VAGRPRLTWFAWRSRETDALTLGHRFRPFSIVYDRVSAGADPWSTISPPAHERGPSSVALLTHGQRIDSSN